MQPQKQESHLVVISYFGELAFIQPEPGSFVKLSELTEFQRTAASPVRFI
jgi:hypothetical protein